MRDLELCWVVFGKMIYQKKFGSELRQLQERAGKTSISRSGLCVRLACLDLYHRHKERVCRM